MMSVTDLLHIILTNMIKMTDRLAAFYVLLAVCLFMVSMD